MEWATLIRAMEVGSSSSKQRGWGPQRRHYAGRYQKLDCFWLGWGRIDNLCEPVRRWVLVEEAAQRSAVELFCSSTMDQGNRRSQVWSPMEPLKELKCFRMSGGAQAKIPLGEARLTPLQEETNLAVWTGWIKGGRLRMNQFFEFVEDEDS